MRDKTRQCRMASLSQSLMVPVNVYISSAWRCFPNDLEEGQVGCSLWAWQSGFGIKSETITSRGKWPDSSE
jgi:hypothetical protein